jgi:hypothetical protein
MTKDAVQRHRENLFHSLRERLTAAPSTVDLQDYAYAAETARYWLKDLEKGLRKPRMAKKPKKKSKKK